MKSLRDLGLARAKPGPGRRGRPRTTYSITAKGRRALTAWLGTEPASFSLHFEALLRVHLAPYGSPQDLIGAPTAARGEAEQLLRQAIVIGTEFAEERRQFQEQVHVRAILFDFLRRFGLSMFIWADHWIEPVATWPSTEITEPAQREALALIRGHLADAPDALA